MQPFQKCLIIFLGCLSGALAAPVDNLVSYWDFENNVNDTARSTPPGLVTRPSLPVAPAFGAGHRVSNGACRMRDARIYREVPIHDKTMAHALH